MTSRLDFPNENCSLVSTLIKNQLSLFSEGQFDTSWHVRLPKRGAQEDDIEENSGQIREGFYLSWAESIHFIIAHQIKRAS